MRRLLWLFLLPYYMTIGSGDATANDSRRQEELSWYSSSSEDEASTLRGESDHNNHTNDANATWIGKQGDDKRIGDPNFCLFCITDVCVKRSDDDDDDFYETVQRWGLLWWITNLLGFEKGVWGACESVCNCGDNGTCTFVNYEMHVCECSDGYIFNRESCIADTGFVPDVCGGIAGLVCGNGTVCMDDPLDDCDPEVGSDCFGICLPLCDDSMPCPSSELQCESFPCDAVNGDDCMGVCVSRTLPPHPFCQGDNSVACKDGYTCFEDLRDDCAPDLSRSCIGVCQKSCGGSQGLRCNGESEVCVDIQDDGCEPEPFAVASTCLGVCVEVPDSCGGPLQIACPMGHVCLNNPGACEDGEDCPGQCYPECNVIIDERLPCPYGTQCVDVPFDYCPTGTECPKVCSTGCLSGIPCQLGAQCLPTPCANPDPDISPPPECFPVCVEAPLCGGLLPSTCTNDDFLCLAVNPGDTCRQDGLTDCYGACLPKCGGPDNLTCDNDEFCNDDPFDNCDPVNGGTDCFGTCLRVKDPPIFCNGSGLASCPPNFECFDSSGTLCNVDSGTCQGYCRRKCGGSLGCEEGQTCRDYSSDACFSPSGTLGCLMFCEDTT